MVNASLRAWCDSFGYSLAGVPAGIPVPVQAGSVAATIDIRAAGRLKFFRVRRNVVGNAPIFTVYKNGVATAITVTFAAGDAEKSDDVNQVIVAKGDTVEVVILGDGIVATMAARAALGVFPA